MRAAVIVRYLCLVVALGAVSCGGGGSGPPPSPSPTPTPTPSPSPGTPGQVAIVGQQAGNSFTPNPSTAGANGAVTWMNQDNVAHRIVANDGSFDTGNILPGASSQAMNVSADGARYHCSIHPSMIGAINGNGGTPPPCTGQYC